MIVKNYSKVTHKLTKDLTETILKELQFSQQDESRMGVYSVHMNKHNKDVIVTKFGRISQEELDVKEYVKLIDTSGINRLVLNTPKLQYKTNLENYLYGVLKREEYLVNGVEN